MSVFLGEGATSLLRGASRSSVATVNSVFFCAAASGAPLASGDVVVLAGAGASGASGNLRASGAMAMALVCRWFRFGLQTLENNN